MRPKQVKIQTFRQKPLKKMQVFLQIFFLKPVFQKEEKNMKEIFRSVRMLPNISKILERLWNFSSQNDSHGKGYSKKYYLFSMLEKWKSEIFWYFSGRFIRSLWLSFSQIFTHKNCMHMVLSNSIKDCYIVTFLTENKEQR